MDTNILNIQLVSQSNDDYVQQATPKLSNTETELKKSVGYQKACSNHAFTKIIKISMFMFMYLYLMSDSPMHNHLNKRKSLYTEKNILF